jgi:hypothetical protein
MSEERAALSFVERIGGVLAAPRRTFARLAGGEAHAADIAWLLAGWLVAGDLPGLARCVVMAHAFDVWTGVQQLLRVVSSALLPSILGVMLAGLLLSLLAPRKRRARADAFDLAAYAWVPYLAVQLAGSLAYSLLGREPGDRARMIVTGVGLVWAVAAWACALLAALDAPEAES